MADAYYNENDPFAVAWLRNIIGAGLIAPGEVDARSIVDVRPDDVRGFGQCHFFAGIGVWSYALRRAGWADDRAVWTGSCPCQPFSHAGKRAGTSDDRHLWPDFYRLIRQCRPRVVLGEQVASQDGLGWIDLVQTDMEAAGYAFAALDLCAAGFGAPHIRQRLYWVADTEKQRWSRLHGEPHAGASIEPQRSGAVGGLVDRERARLEGHGGDGDGAARWALASRPVAATGAAHSLADAGNRQFPEPQRRAQGRDGNGPDRANATAGPTNSFWRDADWLLCRDERWRPVEPGTFPLAHGAANRMGRLRGYGNAIVAPVAQAFIEAVMECIP